MHNAQYEDSRYGSQNPYAITVNSNGDVVVSGASKTQDQMLEPEEFNICKIMVWK